jgi:hypothetical protein
MREKMRKLTKATFDNLSDEKKLRIIQTATSEFSSQGF